MPLLSARGGASAKGFGFTAGGAFVAAIASNQTNLNLRTWALANGWNGSSAAFITINSGVYVYSTSTGTAGLTIDGSWPGTVTVVNNGYIMGMGGNGGGWSYVGSAGGPAISLGVNAAITNNSYIGGGGGGGGVNSYALGAGGGAGGGLGGPRKNGSTTAGGGPGASGSNGSAGNETFGKNTIYVGSGGGGGRIMPGTGGSGNSGGGGFGGGSGGGGGGALGQPAGGQAGGSAGSAGGSTAQSTWGSGGGGGWGAAGGDGGSGLGFAGGKAIALNGYTATRTGAGTTYGTVA